MKCTSSAPGKLVLTGEYAVLNGAPAIVLAMNRRAHALVESVDSPTCTFQSTGLEANTQHSLSRLLVDEAPDIHDPAYLVWYVLQALRNSNKLSTELTGLRIHTDSNALFSHGKKLGLGSSAAICTSLTASLLALFGKSVQAKIETIFDNALSAHCAAQNSRGSGLDIAAACYGGVINYARSDSKTEITTIKLPTNLHYQVFNSGQPANTSFYLEKFSAWLETANTQTFGMLCDAARKVANVLSNKPDNWLKPMSEYTLALQNFDTASQQGIYTQAHRSMHILALKHRILYKPCGAGGGDLGIALSDDPKALESFTSAVKNSADTADFLEIDLEIDTNGVHTDSTQTG